jgi:hypothetical protein
MKLVLLLFFCSLISLPSFSQEKEVENRDQAWLGYLNQTRFTNKSGLWVDLHWRRTNDFIKDNAITIARVAYIYYLTDQTRLMAGYAYVTQYGNPDVPEHRPWQQIQWMEKKSWYSLMQWIRVEERFRTKVVAGELTNEYSFNFRVRYNISLTIPLKGKQIVAKTPFVFLNDEVHINAGKNIVYNYFDQNRLFLGVGYQFTSHLNAHIGYMNVFQQQPSGNHFVNINAIRLFVFHNLDFRRAK